MNSFPKKQRSLHKFILYLFTGAINTAFGYGIFSLLIYCSLHYTLAFLFATIAGVIFNFFTTGRIVFKNSNNQLFFRFIFFYSFIYLSNISITKLLTDTHLNVYVAGGIAIISSAVIGFLVLSKFVFQNNSIANHDVSA